MSKPKIELDADVFDTLELSSLVFGGIGAGNVFERGEGPLPDSARTPLCVVGHAIVAADWDKQDNPIVVALEKIGVDVLVNDRAVSQINRVRGRVLDHRVSFTAWRRELGIVRKAS